ncbi:Hypothetical predicted protein [Podarcis lilfordi]|uniref:Uncharacterized protein n=1 Tax=Podarcis lilfordi TaxID=74358 RepID=A0AA35K9A6_9SAUR|nr:Hypothetical predicted protein [Podarcis lilfordi]
MGGGESGGGKKRSQRNFVSGKYTRVCGSEESRHTQPAGLRFAVGLRGTKNAAKQLDLGRLYSEATSGCHPVDMP